MSHLGGDGIAARLRQAIADRGLTRRQVVVRMGPELRGTAYLLLSGKTADPRIDTVAAFCNAIGVDPDDVLGTAPAPLPAEIRGLWEDAQALSEDDRRLLVALIRSVRRSRVGAR